MESVEPCGVGRSDVEGFVTDVGRSGVAGQIAVVEVGWSAADGEDEGAVGPVGVQLPDGGSLGSSSFSVFVSVVVGAFDGGVVLVGAAVFVPFGGVVDLAPAGGQVASGVFAGVGEQHRCVAGGAGEEPLFSAEVDDAALGAE